MTTIEADVPLPDEKPKGKKMSQHNTLREERTVPPVHETRAYETYSEGDVHGGEDTPWIRPSSLEAPTPRKGFRQRWVRVGSMGQDDPTNTARKFREGWRPRPSDSLPKGYHAPTISHGKWAGCVGVEGMVLCEMPEKMALKRTAHYNQKTQLVTDAIEGELQQQSHPNMQITQQRTSRVVKNTKIADDD
jgi:hypothetical protein